MPTHHLLFGQTLWGLEGIDDPPEAGLDRLPAAGFHLVETNEAVLDRPGVMERLKSNHLRLVLQCYPMAVDDLRPSLRRAKALGAIHVNAHAATAHYAEEDAVRLINGMYEAAEDEGVSLMLETHRGRVTQDLYRTARLCERIEQLRLNLDVSHYIVCEERPGPTDDLKPLLHLLLDRCEMIHGRVSNGLQIQVDVGDGSGELAQRYLRFWAETMRRWRLRSRAGSSLIFTPELGPPEYAIRNPQDGRELSDRWAQSLVLKQLAEQAWEMSKRTGTALW